MRKVKIAGGIAAFILFSAIIIFITYAKADKLGALQNGDIVFQTSTSNQSTAVGLASASLYTHTGFIKMTDEGPVVVEATGPVKETPLQEWIGYGYLGRVTVKRLKDITPEQGKAVVHAARKYYGQNYDLYFVFDNGEQYCSELVYLAYKAQGIELGKIQKVKNLFVNNSAVRSLFNARWQRHPYCSGGKVKDSAACWEKVLEQELITPRSVADDPRLETVYSNYGDF